MFSLNPSQNYEHLLQPVSGYDGMHDLMFHAEPHKTAGVVDVDFRRGALCSLDPADGTLVPGLATLASLALWAVNDVTDYDAASDDGNVSGGVVTTYPATGGYELKSTEVDLANFVEADYAPNSLLTGGTGPELGLVAHLAAAVGGEAPVGSNICGVVSKGIQDDVYKQKVVQFWPVYLPARA